MNGSGGHDSGSRGVSVVDGTWLMDLSLQARSTPKKLRAELSELNRARPDARCLRIIVVFN